MLFWGAYEQAGSTLNLFADRYTRLDVFGFAFPSSWFQSVQPIFVILLAPVFALAVASARPRASRRCRRSSRSASCSWRSSFLVLVPGRGDGAERRRRSGQPVVARGRRTSSRSSASCASARSA